MTRLRRPDLPPHLEEKFRKSFPPGTRETPPEDLQLQNLPREEPEHTYPRWDLMLEWWDDSGGDEEC